MDLVDFGGIGGFGGFWALEVWYLRPRGFAATRYQAVMYLEGMWRVEI